VRGWRATYTSHSASVSHKYGGGMVPGNGPGMQRLVEVRIRAVVAVTDEAALLASADEPTATAGPYPDPSPRAVRRIVAFGDPPVAAVG
jgi:hypothetical protein